jgi:hypothetical protein
MTRAKLLIYLVFLWLAESVGFPRPAAAQRDLPLFGTWVEDLPLGAALVTEFTPTSMMSRSRMPNGVYGSTMMSGPTGYHFLGNVAGLGQAYEVANFGPDNKFQGEMTAYLHDPDHLILDLGKSGRHYLHRAAPGS